MKNVKGLIIPIAIVVLIIFKIAGVVALSWPTVIACACAPIVFAVLYAVGVFLFYCFKQDNHKHYKDYAKSNKGK